MNKHFKSFSDLRDVKTGVFSIEKGDLIKLSRELAIIPVSCYTLAEISG